MGLGDLFAFRGLSPDDVVWNGKTYEYRPPPKGPRGRNSSNHECRRGPPSVSVADVVRSFIIPLAQPCAKAQAAAPGSPCPITSIACCMAFSRSGVINADDADLDLERLVPFGDQDFLTAFHPRQYIREFVIGLPRADGFH